MSRRKRATAAALIIAISRKQRRERTRKRIWIKEWIARRPALGAYTMLLDELRSEDPKQLKHFPRMSETDFNFLLQLVSDKISKLNSNMRDSIKARERLALTLRFLATGDSYHSLMYLFRIPVCTISKIIPECCEAVNEVLKNDYFKSWAVSELALAKT
ncbi:hypothetical protein NQ318_014245 [Aromia moschata]|uniref:Nuclease HARBI1 n=1 Tax=Aromia moschata TaxID=1265417 RepID=A0AAV8Z1C7_9CUCU|nr:hypothetical protein NQ318_014245 [Aromia moschata]